MNDQFASRIAAELHDIAQTLKQIQQGLTRLAPVEATKQIKRPGQPNAA
jgi:hypothetical protein